MRYPRCGGSSTEVGKESTFFFFTRISPFTRCATCAIVLVRLQEPPAAIVADLRSIRDFRYLLCEMFGYRYSQRAGSASHVVLSDSANFRYLSSLSENIAIFQRPPFGIVTLIRNMILEFLV